jgi:exopolysaccharide biosynthesis predicted pyruvyltransferase EpsI
MKNAQCVLTDSFHATVFAIIFNKPFCVFERKASEKGNNMGSRIETLLSKFELLNFRDDIENPMKIPQEYADNKVQHILKGERRSSMQFLENALDIRN